VRTVTSGEVGLPSQGNRYISNSAAANKQLNARSTIIISPPSYFFCANKPCQRKFSH